MQWPDEILRTLAEQLDASRETMKASIARDLADQGASPDHIADSLRGVDQLFTAAVQRGLAAFAATVAAELSATCDEKRRLH